MKNINIELPILGKITLRNEDWEYKKSYNITEYKFENSPIDIDVNFKNVNEKTILEVSKALNNLKLLKASSVKAISEDFTNKGEVEYYIKEWNEYIFEQIFSAKEFEKYLSETDKNLSIEKRLLSKIRLVRFGVYAETEDNFIVMDFAFGYDFNKGFRDDMLVVKLSPNYTVTEITTEG